MQSRLGYLCHSNKVGVTFTISVAPDGIIPLSNHHDGSAQETKWRDHNQVPQCDQKTDNCTKNQEHKWLVTCNGVAKIHLVRQNKPSNKEVFMEIKAEVKQGRAKNPVPVTPLD